MNTLDIASGIVIAFALLILGTYKARTRSMNKNYFKKRWQKLEKQCKNQKLWCGIIVEADDLLGLALKKKHYKGKTTGERLVAAQRLLSRNDAVWFSHKLRNKIDDKDLTKISKKDAKTALLGFHKALVDLGALTPASKMKEES